MGRPWAIGRMRGRVGNNISQMRLGEWMAE